MSDIYQILRDRYDVISRTIRDVHLSQEALRDERGPGLVSWWVTEPRDPAEARARKGEALTMSELCAFTASDVGGFFAGGGE